MVCSLIGFVDLNGVSITGVVALYGVSIIGFVALYGVSIIGVVATPAIPHLSCVIIASIQGKPVLALAHLARASSFLSHGIWKKNWK